MAKTNTKRVSRNTAAQLEDALADQAAIESRKVELAKDRQRCLLAGDKGGLEKLRREAIDLQIAEEDARDLIAALKDKQADEAADQAVKARKEHENRLLAKHMEHRDCIVEAGDLVGKLGKVVQRAQGLGTEVNAGWPWGWQDAAPLLLGVHLQNAISYEFYRVSGQALPGWKSPSLTDPRREIIQSLESKADAAIEYAKRRIAETPSRALVLPTAAPTTEAPRPVQADVPVPMPTEQLITAAPSNVPPGEHAFSVAFIHDATGEEHVETIVFGPDEFQRCGHDPLGPLGPAGREVAIEIAQARVPEDYVLKAVTFDMQRLIATSED